MPQPKAKKPNRFKDSRRGAVIYARYSPRPSEDCRTIESQFGQCEKYCEFQDWKVLKKFKDEQASGTDSDREGFLEALAYCKANKAVLLCYKLNRMARNVVDALMTLDDLQKHECDVVLLDILVDTTTPTGRMLFTIMASLAEFQAAEGGQVTSDAMRHHQKANYCMGGIAPYGWKRSMEYDVVDVGGGHKKRRHKMVYDEKEQEVLDLCLRLQTRGWGLRQIAHNLTLLGYKNRSGGVFHASTVLRMLQRENAGLNPVRLTANPRYVRSIDGIVPPPEYSISVLEPTTHLPTAEPDPSDGSTHSDHPSGLADEPQSLT